MLLFYLTTIPQLRCSYLLLRSVVAQAWNKFSAQTMRLQKKTWHARLALREVGVDVARPLLGCRAWVPLFVQLVSAELCLSSCISDPA